MSLKKNMKWLGPRKEMKEDGTYYNTKFKLKEKAMKLPGWDGLKEGKVVKFRNKNHDWLNIYQTIKKI